MCIARISQLRHFCGTHAEFFITKLPKKTASSFQLPNRFFKGNHSVWLLSAVILVGGFLRFWQLGAWSFWIDEVFTVRDAQQFSLENFKVNPIPYFAVKLSMSISGTDEWGSRLIPCLTGILSIPLIFLMGRALFNTRVGALAATFLAFSSWHLFWSQNARSYVFTVLFAILAAWSFYLATERDYPFLMLGSLVATLCLILSHTLSVIFVPALAGYALSFWIPLPFNNIRKALPPGIRPRNLLIFFTPFAFAVLLLVLPQFRGYLFSGWGLNEWQRSPVYILFTLVGGLGVPIAVTAFFASLSKPMVRAKWFLICFSGIPLILFLIASRQVNVAGYYLFFTTPAYLLLAAVGCDQIWSAMQIPSRLRYVLPCLIVVTMLSQDYLYFRIENGGRPKWRAAFSTIRSGISEGDPVFVSAPRMSEFYLPEVPHTNVVAITSDLIEEMLADTEAFEQKWKGSNAVWFVIDGGNLNVYDSGERFRGWVRQRAQLVKTFPVFARAKDLTINVYLWKN